MKKKHRDRAKSSTVGALDDLASQIITAIAAHVIDLEMDTVPRTDYQDLKYLVATHRHP